MFGVIVEFIKDLGLIFLGDCVGLVDILGLSCLGVRVEFFKDLGLRFFGVGVELVCDLGLMFLNLVGGGLVDELELEFFGLGVNFLGFGVVFEFDFLLLLLV